MTVTCACFDDIIFRFLFLYTGMKLSGQGGKKKRNTKPEDTDLLAMDNFSLLSVNFVSSSMSKVSNDEVAIALGARHN
jgi:hypothetical protein